MRLDEGFSGYETMPRVKSGDARYNSIGVGESIPIRRSGRITSRTASKRGTSPRGRHGNLGITPEQRPLAVRRQEEQKRP